MPHRGPFQPRPFCDSDDHQLKNSFFLLQWKEIDNTFQLLAESHHPVTLDKVPQNAKIRLQQLGVPTDAVLSPGRCSAARLLVAGLGTCHTGAGRSCDLSQVLLSTTLAVRLVLQPLLEGTARAAVTPAGKERAGLEWKISPGELVSQRQVIPYAWNKASV